jgi:hypothetical protein
MRPHAIFVKVVWDQRVAGSNPVFPTKNKGVTAQVVTPFSFPSMRRASRLAREKYPDIFIASQALIS